MNSELYAKTIAGLDLVYRSRAFARYEIDTQGTQAVLYVNGKKDASEIKRCKTDSRCCEIWDGPEQTVFLYAMPITG
jgi:hypothetical protein